MFGNTTSSTGGLFGKSSSTPSGGGLFGSTSNNNTTSTTSGGGLFGSSGSGNQGLFGSSLANDSKKPASNGLFGTAGSSSNTTGGLFSKAADKPSGGLFGASTANTDNKPAGSLFGASTANTDNKPAGSLFGASTANTDNKPAGSLFGASTANTDNKPAGSLFGASTANTESKPAGSLFGASAANTDNKPAGSLFGASAAKTDNKPAGSLFGASAAKTDNKPAGSLFGASAANTDNKPAGSLFGASSAKTDDKPVTTSGLFGSKPVKKPEENKLASTGGFFANKSGLSLDSDKGDGKKVSFAADTKTPAPTKTADVAASENKTENTSSNTTLSTPAVTKPVTVALEPVSLENQTVQDLIKNWANKLLNCQQFFEVYGENMNKWDSLLSDNSDKLAKLYSEVLETEQLSSTIDQNLLYMEKQQDDIENFLDYYEEKVNDIYLQDESIMLNNIDSSNSATGSFANDKKREAAYTNAIALDSNLDALTTDLTNLITDINNVHETFNSTIYKNNSGASSLPVSSKKSADKPYTEDEYSVSNIIKLMNIHLNSLKWLEANGDILKKKIDNYKNL